MDCTQHTTIDWEIGFKTFNKEDLFFRVNNGTEMIETGTKILQQNVWYQLTGVFTGEEIKIYVNGVQEGSASFNGSPAINDTQLLLGKDVHTGNNFTGTIDEIAIWNRALSTTEISDFYENTPPIVERSCYDVTGDSEVNIFDMVYIATRFNTVNSIGDIDNSGLIDLDDLLSIVGRWGRCSNAPQLPQCTMNEQITEPCLCEDTEYSNGYCCATGYSSSTCTVTPALTINANPTTSNFVSSTNVILTTNDSEADIYYTINESEPDLGSQIYSSPINFTQTTTLKFFAKNSEQQTSIQTQIYTKTTGTPPTANIEVFADTGIVPFTVLFNAKNSSNDVVRYEWDFKEQNSDYEQYDLGRMTGHRFDSTGTYQVQLSVYNESGLSDTETKTINVLSAPAEAKTYYISNSGNGTNNGLSESTPWNFSKLNTELANIPAGSKILFKKGETITIGASWAVKNLMKPAPYYSTISAYGSGSSPMLTGQITTEPASGNLGLIFDGVDISSGISIRPKFIDNATRFDFPGNQVTVRNGSIGHIGMWDSSGVNLENLVLDCKQSGGNGFGANIQNVQGIEYLYMNNVEVKNCISHGVYIAGGAPYRGVGKNTLVENSSFHHNGIYPATPDGRRDGFTTHGFMDNFIFRNNEVYNNGYALGFDSGYNDTKEYFRDFIIEDNKIYNQKYYGLQLSSQQNLIIRNNLIYNNSPQAINGVIRLVKPHNYSGVNDEDSFNVQIINNTFYNNNNTIFAISDTQVHDVYIKNNIILGNNGTIIEDNDADDLVVSNNIYYGPFTGGNFKLNGTTYTLDEWLQIETSAKNIDPLLIAPESGNFKLNNGSEAIDHGTSVNAKYDFEGTLRDSFPDAGAFEN